MVKLNNQTFFNSVVLHLFEQKRPALADNCNCAYRTKTGLKCAVGAVLPDAVFDGELEFLKQTTVSRLIAYSPMAAQILTSVDRNLLRKAQELHDKSLPRYKGEDGITWFELDKLQGPLEELAKKFGLNTDVFSPYQSGGMTLMNKLGMPPPHSGWWSTESKWDETPVWRWWDGQRWSLQVREYMPPELIAKRASLHSSVRKTYIAYSNYWPENARVPRLNPDVPL